MNIVSNSGLNPKEKMLLQSLADGVPVSNSQVMKNMLLEIRNKLGADTTIQAVAMGIRRHIID